VATRGYIITLLVGLNLREWRIRLSDANHVNQNERCGVGNRARFRSDSREVSARGWEVGNELESHSRLRQDIESLRSPDVLGCVLKFGAMYEVQGRTPRRFLEPLLPCEMQNTSLLNARVRRVRG